MQIQVYLYILLLGMATLMSEEPFQEYKVLINWTALLKKIWKREDDEDFIVRDYLVAVAKARRIIHLGKLMSFIV